jgi:sugar phosphate isomerase/epimerase
MKSDRQKTTPKLACCNFIADREALKAFAVERGFQGIDWSFTPENVPVTSGEESALEKTIQYFHPLEVRYHCAFPRLDLGNNDDTKAEQALETLSRLCRLVSALGGSFLTIHIGLGRNTTYKLSWERTIKRLTRLVNIADDNGVRLCLENLAWGWTSRPELFEKLVRKSGSGVTIDIGHARVSPSVVTRLYDVDDFTTPHRERIFNAHIYHTEKANNHHAPETVKQLQDRLQLLQTLPHCDWWVLELREESALLKTLAVVREFLHKGGTSEGSGMLREEAVPAV